MDEELIKEVLQYIEDMEETIDGERGSCRTAGELIASDSMPDLYKKLKNLVN